MFLVWFETRCNWKTNHAEFTQNIAFLKRRRDRETGSVWFGWRVTLWECPRGTSTRLEGEIDGMRQFKRSNPHRPKPTRVDTMPLVRRCRKSWEATHHSVSLPPTPNPASQTHLHPQTRVPNVHYKRHKQSRRASSRTNCLLYVTQRPESRQRKLASRIPSLFGKGEGVKTRVRLKKKR